MVKSEKSVASARGTLASEDIQLGYNEMTSPITQNSGYESRLRNQRNTATMLEQHSRNLIVDSPEF